MPGIAVSGPEPVTHAQRLLAPERSRRTVKIAIGATVLAWVPLLLLCAFQGPDSVWSFSVDYAAQSRLLLVIAILIIAEPSLTKKLDLIATHFLEDRLIRADDQSHFESVLARYRHMGNVVAYQMGLLLFAFLITASALPYIEPGTFMAWCYGSGGVQGLSPAGSWYVLVSLPIILYLFLRWIWRQLLWALFLGAVSGMNLQTIPAHPDRVAGLGFIETCYREYIPFAFAVGTMVAGGIANRVVHGHQRLEDYNVAPLLVGALVIAICCAPLCFFIKTLLAAKRRGIFKYGALASFHGRQFEERWLVEKREAQGALEAPDFSATIDLYSVVANVDQMRMFPLPAGSITKLAIWSIVPGIPVLLASLGVKAVVKELIKMVI